jgi:hypothetical protein
LSFGPLPILGPIKNVYATFDWGKVTFRISKIITTVDWCNKSSELHIFCVKFEWFQGFCILKKRTTKVICSSKKFVWRPFDQESKEKEAELGQTDFERSVVDVAVVVDAVVDVDVEDGIVVVVDVGLKLIRIGCNDQILL